MVILADNFVKLGPFGEPALVQRMHHRAGFVLAGKLDIEHAAQMAAFNAPVSASRSPFSSTIRITPSAARLSA